MGYTMASLLPISAVFLYLTLGCSSVDRGVQIAVAKTGPKAKVMLSKKEAKKFRMTGNIMMPNYLTLDKKTNSILRKTALDRFGERLQGDEAVDVVLKGMSPPFGTRDLIFAEYQGLYRHKVIYYHQVNRDFRGRKRVIKSLDLASWKSVKRRRKAMKPLQTEQQVKGVLSDLNPLKKYLNSILDSLDRGVRKPFYRPKSGEISTFKAANKLRSYVMGKLNSRYILLTHIIGNSRSWERGREVKMTAALVNYETGDLRYYSELSRTKGTLGLSYEVILGAMSHKLYEPLSREKGWIEPAPLKTVKDKQLSEKSVDLKKANLKKTGVKKTSLKKTDLKKQISKKKSK
tara:strand:+ start:312 stop:1349 length:1038 start_codon:yes stop_codon:yes gene_type:complete